MKDDLEDYIYRNREDFDDLEPDSQVWGAIESSMARVKPDISNLYWKAAAVILLLICAGLLLERRVQPEDKITAEETSRNAELLQVETYYISLITERRSEIEMAAQTMNLDQEILTAELDELDVMYQDLRRNLILNENNDRLMDAMIQNLQMRIKILNQQKLIIEKLKNYETDEITI